MWRITDGTICKMDFLRQEACPVSRTLCCGGLAISLTLYKNFIESCSAAAAQVLYIYSKEADTPTALLRGSCERTASSADIYKP